MLAISDFDSHRRAGLVKEWPLVLLGSLPGQDGWLAMGKAGAQIVPNEVVEEAPQLFVRATQLPPGTREYMRPVESPPIEALFTPEYLPWPLVPRFGVHRTLIFPMLVDDRWRVYCGYDTLAREWVVAGEPEEVTDARTKSD